MKKKIICIIQARLGSTRFPGKIFKNIKRNKIIHLLFKRIKKSKLINKIVIAIPNTKKDDRLYKYLKKKKINIFRGNEKNVLDRYYKAAKYYKADVIIRVTSDCPVLSADIVDEHIKIYFKKKCKVLSNYLTKTYPVGISFSIFDYESLKKAKIMATSKYDKEHVMPFIYRNMRTKLLKTSTNPNYKKLRLTLDYPEDLVTIKNIFNEMYPNIYFSWKKVIKLYHKKPLLFKNLNIKKN